MVGLVFVDRLTLTAPHSAALTLSIWAILACPDWRGVIMGQAVMLTAFWDQAISLDTRLLFSSARYLGQYDWPQFCSELAFADYVKLQPPFYTLWVSRWPSLPCHQILQAGLMVGGGLLMFRVYGAAAKYLLSTPLFLLMSTQPSNDVICFLGLLGVIHCVQLRRRSAAAVLLGLTWLIKPLALLAIPVLLPKLKGWIVLSLVIVAGYLAWSQHFYFGVKQWQFLLFQLSFGRLGAR